MVSLVKDGLKVQTLAIGDGANDVNMIQVANVGVGIGGQEGMQAVMASDFAISRFSFLERLIIVHGHICYDKLAHTALYLFYKDAVSLAGHSRLFLTLARRLSTKSMFTVYYSRIFCIVLSPDQVQG